MRRKQAPYKIKNMSTVKRFKIRKLYQRKKICVLEKKENNYILISISNKLRTHLKTKRPNVIYNYLPSYLQITKISAGGKITRLIPMNFKDFIRENNADLRECMSIFYNNKWYPGYIFNSIKNYEKNLLSVLILLKGLKR